MPMENVRGDTVSRLPMKLLSGRKYPFCDWRMVEPGYGMPFWDRYQRVHGTKPWLSPKGVALRTYDLSPGSPVAGMEPTGQVGAYCTLMKDGDKYRLWHETYGGEARGDLSAKICVIESSDCREFVRPELNLIEYEGRTANNIVFGFGLPETGGGFGGHGATVMKDHSALASERYKLVFLGLSPEGEDLLGWVYGAVSPDGYSWRMLPEPVARALSDTQNVCARVENGYKLVLRGWNPMGLAGGGGRRSVRTCFSERFGGFPEPTEILCPPSSFGPMRDIYTSAWQMWPGADIELMLPTLYDRDTDTTEVHVAVSRDGLQWDFPTSRPLYGGRHLPGTQTVYAGVGIVETAPMTWGIPLFISDKAHNEYRLKTRQIHIATIREDGFTAIEADLNGTFSLFPAAFECDSIKLNAVTRPGGSVTARLFTLDQDGGPVPVEGFDYRDFEPLTGNVDWSPLTWNGKKMPEPAGRPLRLEFDITRARLHALKAE